MPFSLLWLGPLFDAAVCDSVLIVAGEMHFPSPLLAFQVRASSIARRFLQLGHNPQARAAVLVSYVFVCKRACDETGSPRHRLLPSQFGRVTSSEDCFPEEAEPRAKSRPRAPVVTLSRPASLRAACVLRDSVETFRPATLREEGEVRRVECLPPPATNRERE